ncbi:MAG: PilZ domain-containing protein [Pseudomonadota bacterium]
MVLGRSEEKRGFRRMTVDCRLAFAIDGQPGRHTGQATDLSASGLAFICEATVAEGANLEVEVSPASALTPPLHARVEVLRVEETDSGQRVSCRIVEMLS